MKVDTSRLLNLLGEEEGFSLAWQDPEEFGLGRASRVGALHEQIVISSAGRAGEALACDVAISVAHRQLGTKGMCELELLTDLATDPERGVAIVHTNEEVQDWERRVAEAAPEAAKELALRKGAALLARTGAARSAVESYLRRLPDSADLRVLRQWLLSRVTEEGRKQARELAESPGVLQKAGAERLYEVTCLTIVCFEAGRVSSQSRLDPLEDRELMWRIQLLVDHLERGQISGDRQIAEA